MFGKSYSGVSADRKTLAARKLILREGTENTLAGRGMRCHFVSDVFMIRFSESKTENAEEFDLPFVCIIIVRF